MVANPRHATALSSTHARNSARQFPRSKNANVPHGETMPHLGCHMQVHTAHKLLPEGASVGTVYIVRTLITPAAGALIVWCFHSEVLQVSSCKTRQIHPRRRYNLSIHVSGPRFAPGRKVVPAYLYLFSDYEIFDRPSFCAHPRFVPTTGPRFAPGHKKGQHSSPVAAPFCARAQNKDTRR